MYVRFVKLRVKPGMEAAYERYFREYDAPMMMQNEGCLFAHLIQDESDHDALMALSFWRSEAHARAYEESGRYAALIAKNRPFLEDSSEWRMQLTEDLTLSYVPVAVEPEVESFEVAASSSEAVPTEEGLSHMYLRIVEGKTDPGQVDAFARVYREEVIPALKQIDGCRYAYLAAGRNENEIMSVTLWESKAHALAYEASGQFDELLSKTRPWMSALTQWKMALDATKQSRTVTSEDVAVRGFRVLGGESRDDA